MTGRRVGWRMGWSLALAAAAAGCQDRLTSPGVCPAFCPEGEIVVRDTLLADVVESRGSYAGYRLPHEAAELQIVGPGGPAESRAVIVFFRFGGTFTGGDAGVRDTIRQLDSLRFTFNVVRRNAGARGVTLAVHEIPITTDSTKSFADLAPYFQDSTLVATVAVPDTLAKGIVSVTVPAAQFRHFVADSFQSGIGVRISSAEPAYLSLGRSDTIAPAQIRRFVQLDSSAGTAQVTRSDTRAVYFRTFVVDSTRLPPPGGLVVGGLGAARAFLKVALPSRIVDSALVVRATLVLPLARPVFGAPGDTVRVRVDMLSADLGPKSPLFVVSADTGAGSARIATGSSEPLALDLTSVVRAWRTTTLPRTVMLRLLPEAGTIDVLELAAGDGGARPSVLVTYALPFRIPGS